MQAADAGGEDDRVPQLVSGWETRAPDLSPEEGFLLSRIDGTTPWRVLREIAGVAPERADACLAAWVEAGLVALEARPGAPQAGTCGGETREGSDGAGAVDPSLDIPVALQREILEFEASLDRRPYHEILGVARDADERTIKRAYFQRSKVFHPDRYFRRRTGDFAGRLDRIFKKVALAYELMLDPATRAEIQRSMPEPPSGSEAGPKASAGGPTPRRFTKREWLARMRRQFKIPDEVLAERRFRARQLAESARVAQHQKRWNEAASNIRLAIAFDPWSDDFKEQFAHIQAEVNALRAEQLLEQAGGAWDARSRTEALRLYEEAMAYRPGDADVQRRAAEVALEVDDLERAREYAECACEMAPEVAANHLVLSRVLRREGLRGPARKALERARELDPHDERIQEELMRARRRSGRATGGTR